MSTIYAIDPGTTESGWVLFDRDKGSVLDAGVSNNEVLLDYIRSHAFDGGIAIEMIASYGMPVGREVFQTCVWIGRFQQAAFFPGFVRLIYRQDVKLYLCGTPRAKDGNIRQALIDLVGPQGCKAKPGPTYGVKSHSWAALGVAVTAAQFKRQEVAA